MASQMLPANPLTAGRPIQPPVRHRALAQVTLTDDARKNFNLLCREKAEHFKADLDHGFQQLDTIINGLAAKHHKSVRQVESQLHIGRSKLQAQRSKISAWNAFCWKKRHEDAAMVTDSNMDMGSHKHETLPNLVREYREDYHKLTDSEKQDLIKQFSEVKKGKDVGTRVSARSRINDATQTLNTVQNELHGLKSRTGMETILYSTCGTTDVRIRGVTFATEGAENFMGTVMGIDDQDLISKMGGFAVQGVRGAVNDHRQRLVEMRSHIRDIINKSLRATTGEPDAKMQWKYYFRNVVSRYMVAIEGWPDEVPFKNLSEVSCSLALLETLYKQWEDKRVKWKKLSAAEYEELRRAHNEQISRGEITEPVRRLRSDRGTKRTRSETGDQTRRKKHKSTETIQNNEDEDDDILLPLSNSINSRIRSAAASTSGGGETAAGLSIPGSAPGTQESSGAETANSRTAATPSIPVAAPGTEDSVRTAAAATVSGTVPNPSSIPVAAPGTEDSSEMAAAATATVSGIAANPSVDGVASGIATLEGMSSGELDALGAHLMEQIDSFDFTEAESSFFSFS